MARLKGSLNIIKRTTCRKGLHDITLPNARTTGGSCRECNKAHTIARNKQYHKDTYVPKPRVAKTKIDKVKAIKVSVPKSKVIKETIKIDKVVIRKGCGHLGKASSTHDNLCTDCWLSTKLCPTCGYSLYLKDSLVSSTKTYCRVCPYLKALATDVPEINTHPMVHGFKLRPRSNFNDIQWKIYLGSIYWVCSEHIAKINNLDLEKVKSTETWMCNTPWSKGKEHY